MTCEHCREQMLPYLYDLLESLEREQVGAHVESCADCRDAFKATQEQVGLLAEAVKPVKAEIIFKAPVQATPASTAPTTVLPGPPRRLPLLNRWAMAASILLLLFTAGGVIGWTSWREQSESLSDARTRLAKARLDLTKAQGELNQKRDQNQSEIRAIQKELDEVFNQWKKEEANTRKTLEKERVQIIINGPRAPLAGAPNRYDVELRNEFGNFQDQIGRGQNTKLQQLPGNMPQMQARVVDQKTKKVVYEQQLRLEQNNSRANFDLPSDLPIGPTDDLTLEFETMDAAGKAVTLRDNLKLVFPEYVTHLAIDRPMYRPGETVRFRSLTLERFSLKPPDQDFHLRYRILGPRGEEVFIREVASQVVAGKDNAKINGPGGQPLRGLGTGDFTLPVDSPEGLYTLLVGEVNERFNEEKRYFQVRRWQTPRFNKEVTFHRSSYGPGDQVKFTVKASPVQGQAKGLRNTSIQIRATAKVDGQAIHVDTGRAFYGEKDTRLEFTLALPGQLVRGNGSVSIICDDGAGNLDTTVRSLPIVLNDLLIDFYPEGGDLIAGVPNRVYFQARTPANKPADFEGTVLDDGNREVVRIRTLTDDREPGINQGLGFFTFIPELNRRYLLRIDSPIGIDKRVSLPPSKATGVAIHLLQNVVENEIPLRVYSAAKPRELLIGAYCRGRMLDHKVVKAQAGKPVVVKLRPQTPVGGVYRITVFEKLRDADGVTYRPLAERLTYRQNNSHVDVAISSDRPSYQPGDPVELTLQARNEKKEFVPAVALVAVVDASVRKLVDDKTERSMPTHFLLTTEIRNPYDLENADVLLGNHPQSATALDLLLGSQGWRRFAEQDPNQFALRNQQEKTPVFLANSTKVPQLLDSDQKQLDKVDQLFVVKAIDLNKKLAEHERDDGGARDVEQKVVAMHAEVQMSQNHIDNVNRRMREIRGFMIQFGLGGALLTLLFVGFYLVSVGLRRLSDGRRARPWIFTGFALLGLLFLVSVIGTFTLMGEPLLDDFRFDNDRMAKMPFAAVKKDIGNPPAQDQDIALAMVEEEIPAELQQDPPLAVAKKKGFLPAAAQLEPVFQQNDQKNWIDNNFAMRQQGGVMNLDDRFLRQTGNYQAIMQRELGRRVSLPPVNDPSVVREYAHHHQAQKDDVRRDFTETVFWHPVLVLPDGNGVVRFDLSDSVTQYDVAVLAHTLDGRLGSNRTTLTAKLPFQVEPKVPTEVTQSDQIVIPVAISNEMANEASASLTTRLKGLTLNGNNDRAVAIPANESRRELYHVQPSIKDGDASFRISGKTPGRGDAVERKFKVVADGFPVEGSVSGTLENAGIEQSINLPEQWIPGTLQVHAHFYPSSLAELQSGIEAMLREPAGCFEQSSSSNYPNLLILDYLKHTRQNGQNPVAEKKARQLLQSGYQKLTAFECVDPDKNNVKRGYEWFGGTAPPHEALTAYGLLQFRDMAKVQRVETDMLDRTEKYLLDQRDGNGGFQRNARAFDQFGRAPDAVTNAYIVWALTESGVKENLDGELTALREASKNSKDPYYLALAALSHLNRKKTPEGLEMLRQVRTLQKEDGHVAGAATSITGSQGKDLLVETTALATLGWLKAERGEFNPNVQSSIRWLGQQRRGAGNFGGTQATILALKAMVAHAQRHPRVLQGGDVHLSLRPVDFGGAPRGNKFAFRDDLGDFDGQRASFSPRSNEPITLTLRDLDLLVPGRNVVHLNAGNNTMPYTLTWSYRTLKPANDPAASVKIATSLTANVAKEGETVKLKAVVENVSGKGHGMTVAILGIPAGLAVPEDAQQLKALTQMQAGAAKIDAISAWELRGRDLVLYWRDLGPKAKIEVELDLICRLPGIYRGPASRAYLYYDSDRKFWVDPLNIRINEAK